MPNEISPFTLESWAYWTGIAAVGGTAAGALFACVLFWFSSRAKLMKDGRSLAEETTAQALTESIARLQRSTDQARKAAVAFIGMGALFGCLSWWLSFTVSETKEQARMRFESDYAAALADLAVANERTGKLEVEAAGLREQAARAEDLMKVAEAQSEEAKKKAVHAREGRAKALAETAAANERAAHAESELMKVKERMERRAISDAQRTRLQQALKPIQKKPIKIIAVLGDEEAGKFAKEISDILKEAGWIDIHVRRGVFSGGIDGFEIRIRDRVKVPVYALQIARAFDSIGFEPSLVLDSSVAEGTMEIIVGTEQDSG